ncbi:MAG: cysteine desulfurase [Flavobacteriales bacterium]|jgi:cysteine desulfurase|tara:strand:- start:1741 stop:2883 length:1143 start_codon:yes stop_codon:yes gene_type:complete
MEDSIYLDYAATTPVHPDVLKAMLPFFTEHFGNSSSSTHQHGWYTKGAIKRARKQVAKAINCEESEIIFTSGGTEGINQGIKGIFNLYHKKGNHIIVSKTEHKAVLDTIKSLEKKGADITYLDVNSEGIITKEAFESAIKPTTILAAVMWVNNETGVIQNVKELSEIAFQNNVPFLCDGTQAVGKVEIDMQDSKIGVLPISAHKFYGPKGIGALYIRRKSPRITLESLITGGNQENKLRAGTLNTPSVVGLGEAIEIAVANLESNTKILQDIKTQFKALFVQFNAKFNEAESNTSQHVLNVCLPTIKANNLLKHTRKISYSLGSACTSETLDPSHVLTAMGQSKEEAFSSFRLSFSPTITQKEIDTALNTFSVAMTSLLD